MGTHAVKIKLPGDKIWHFLTPDGSVNRLRIYAATAEPDRCQRYADEIKQNHPDVDTKVVKL